MKVLLITPWFPNKRNGWPGTFVAESAVALANRGVEVGVLVFRAFCPTILEQFVSLEHRGRIQTDDFPELYFVSEHRYPSFPGSRFQGLKNGFQDSAVRRVCEAALDQFQPDLIHIHTEQLAPVITHVARCRRVPTVVTVHGINTNQRYISGNGQSARFRKALGDAEKLIIVGENLRDYVYELSGTSENIECVWNGVNVPKAQRTPVEPDDLPLKLITVANLQKEKGVHLLLDALAMVKKEGERDWQLEIVGSGPEEENLRRQMNDLGLDGNVDFVGNLPNDRVQDRLFSADIFVLPSYREAFGIVYLEAMANGLLAIGVEGQGPSQFIEHGQTGYLIPSENHRVLGELLVKLMKGERQHWRRIAAQSADFVRRNATWAHHADELLEIYGSIHG